jgi:hypothetical protein
MTRIWTIERAEGAVKAAFFSRSILTPDGPEHIWLRFTQIREAVTANEGKIGDRTLSRTLKSLLTSGQLKRREEGKAALYGLVIPKPALVKAFARAEGAAVEAAGTVGGWGDGSEGWAVFGVPENVPRKYRGKLRTECLRHQSFLRDILDEILGEYVDSVLQPARRRVSRKTYRAGEKGLDDLLEIQLLGIEGVVYSSRIWQLVEKTVPGTLDAFRKTVLPGVTPEIPVGEGVALVVSKLGGVPIEEVRPEVERELGRVQRRVEAAAAAVRPLWESLTKAEQERASRRLQAASTMAAALTSIVHA